MTLVETWLGTVEGDGELEHVEVFHDPPKSEFSKLLREHGMLRGWLGKKHLVVFAADCTHGKVEKELRKQGVADVFSGEEPINLHFAKDSPFLEVENWRVQDEENGDPGPLNEAMAIVKSHPLMIRLYGPSVELDVRQAY